MNANDCRRISALKPRTVLKCRAVGSAPARRVLSSALKLCGLALLLPAPHAFAQGGAAAMRCPAVRVACPDTAFIGSVVTFTAEVTGGEPTDRLTYSWSVSAGTIVTGEGTSSVTVDLTGVEHMTNLTASVKVGGLSVACASGASCTLSVRFLCVLITKFDEYGNIRWSNEKARLDNFAITLQNLPDTRGHLICYGGRRGRAGEARSRCDRAKNYLVNERNIDPARVVTIDGGFREEITTELWVLPPDMEPPTPMPTVDPAEVRIITEDAPRRGRRRANARGASTPAPARP